ncbi:uncharacterized protein LOC106649359 [Trichogramma pretiosum]|uniref:uncharacterized protein LOC106649359 n=1 Tax=Trichogramma pretiosum TaxID=7493 RepID=UPI000C71B571|nr:uncharacterized protein LOC106649359 [Trichogramma pretiosum]
MENIEVLYSELEAKSKTDQDLTESTTSFFKEKLSNVTEKNKNQILICAVKKRIINIIRYFVKAEIKVSLPLNTKTAIHIAANYKYTEFFDLLFHVYGNVNYKIMKNMLTFSHFRVACMTNNVQRVQNFINSGVKVNTGKPLLEAIERKHLEVIKLLLKSGANANVVDKRGRTPLHLIFSQFSDGTEYETNLELFRLLIKAKSDVNKTDENGNSPMFYLLDRDLCIDNKKKTLEILLQNGADVTHVNKFGDSIMHYIFGCKNRKERDIFELVELFLKYGAHVNATDKRGMTPLHLICSQLSNITDRGHEFAIYTIKLLLSNGANINTVDGLGITPINLLCSQLSNIIDHGDEFAAINTVELILSNGVNINTAVDTLVLIKYNSDVNRKDKDGNSPIFNLFGECCGNILQWNALKILLQNGANITHINSAGDTILHHLIKLNYEKEKYVIKIYELLLRNGADVNAVDSFGRTPINLLCRYLRNSHYNSYSRISQLLIEHKSDINKNDSNGNSPIFNLFDKSWISTFQLNALQLFLKNGANVRYINNAGDSILHHIINSNKNEKKPKIKNQKKLKTTVDVVVELLLNNEADVNAVDSFGRTPINLLCYQLNGSSSYDPDLKILQLLIEHKSDVNRTDKQGNSPMFNLFHKTNFGGIADFQLDALKILLNNGANVTEVNNAGHTIAHYTNVVRNSTTTTSATRKGPPILLRVTDISAANF